MKKILAGFYALLIAVIISTLSLPPPVFSASLFSTIQFRRGTAAAWTAADNVLAQGEPGYETDTALFKIGDGLTHWSSLPYYNRVGLDNTGSFVGVNSFTGDNTGNIAGYDNITATTRVRAPSIGSASYTDNGYFGYVFDNNVVNVMDPRYGAVGDNTTDDAAAIQAAIDALEAASPQGGKILFPVGQYNLGTTGLTIKGNGIILEGISPRFVGASAFGVEFLYSGAGAAVTFGEADVIYYRNEFNNIQVRASGTAITEAAAIGVKMINQHYLTSRNAAIKDFKAGTGLYITAAGTSMFGATCQYQGLLVHQCKTGIKSISVDSLIKDNHAIFLGGAIIGETSGGIAGSVGIDLDQYADGYRFYGTDVESYAIGYKIAGTSHAFFGTRSEFCTLVAQIDNTAVHAQFYGHQWAGTGRTAAVISNSGTLTNIIDSYGYSGKMLVWPFVDMSEAFHLVKSDGSTTIIDVVTSGSPVVGISNADLIVYTDNVFTDVGFRVDNTGNTLVKGKFKVTGLDNSSGSGTGYLYYDPADGNRVKYVP